MRVRTVTDLGGAIRQQRLDLGWSQQDLAARAAVSRQWVIGIEKGKLTAEVGAVLRALAALDLTIDLLNEKLPHGAVDLDEVFPRRAR